MIIIISDSVLDLSNSPTMIFLFVYLQYITSALKDVCYKTICNATLTMASCISCLLCLLHQK